jgi:dTDP-glucose 4,6-dehydratase
VREAVGARSEIAFKPLPQDDPRVRRPDISVARRVLGWEPQVGFEEGMRRTIAWFRRRLTQPALGAAAV